MKPTTLATKFVAAFQAFDVDQVKSLMADDVINYITNAAGEADRVEGAEAYAERFRAMQRSDVEFTLAITQMVQPRPDQVMLMIEVRASRPRKVLHNFAGFLITVNDEGKISESWMVDARPKESDRFWLG